jgi:hypothetical protein
VSKTIPGADLMNAGSLLHGEDTDRTDKAMLSNLPIVAVTKEAAVATARAYLDKFKLLSFVQELLGTLLRERPAEPFSFLLAHLQKLNGQDSRGQIPAAITSKAGEAEEEAGYEEPSPSPPGANAEVVVNKWLSTVAMSSSAAKMTVNNEELRVDNKRMFEELSKLQANCEKQGLLLPPREDEAMVPALATQLDEDPAKLGVENFQLRVEHEKLRARLCEVALVFSRHLNDCADLLAQAGVRLKDPEAAQTAGTKGRASQFACGSRSSMVSKTSDRAPIGSRIGSKSSPRSMKSHPSELSMSPMPDIEDDIEETDSEIELEEESWKEFVVTKRRHGVSAEAYGAWNNRRAAFVPPSNTKTDQQHRSLIEAFCNCPLFAHIDFDIVKSVTWSMPLLKLGGGQCIVKQGDDGDALFVIVSGQAEVFLDKRDTKTREKCKAAAKPEALQL